MLRATNDDSEYKMKNVEHGVMFRHEKQGLICNFFIDYMKVETNQWEWEKKA
jgi:hypothetical protein